MNAASQNARRGDETGLSEVKSLARGVGIPCQIDRIYRVVNYSIRVNGAQRINSMRSHSEALKLSDSRSSRTPCTNKVDRGTARAPAVRSRVGRRAAQGRHTEQAR